MAPHERNERPHLTSCRLDVGEGSGSYVAPKKTKDHSPLPSRRVGLGLPLDPEERVLDGHYAFKRDDSTS